MQPSLFRSYRLNAQFSLSVTEPFKMMDRPVTKSCNAEGWREREVRVLVPNRSGGGREKLEYWYQTGAGEGGRDGEVDK